MQLKVDYEVAAARRYPEQVVIALAKDTNGQINPITISWTMTASRKPPMIAIAVSKQRYFLEATRSSGAFVVCYPSTEMTMEAKFFGTRSGHDLDKLTECPIRTQSAHQVDGVISRDAIANFECRLEQEVETGDHVVLIGRVVESHVSENDDLERLYNLEAGYVLGRVRGEET